MRVIGSFFVRQKAQKKNKYRRIVTEEKVKVMKKILKGTMALAGICCLSWASVMVIFAKNSGVGEQAVRVGKQLAVDPNMAILATGLMAVVGIAVFIKRNLIKEKV